MLHAAFAAALLCLSMYARAQPAPALTLDDAIARVADTHPDLRLIDSRAKVLDAERELASLRPALVAGVSIENALGSGDV
ncbi:MAG: TolC family protein, partial [Dokdonella sp.]